MVRRANAYEARARLPLVLVGITLFLFLVGGSLHLMRSRDGEVATGDSSAVEKSDTDEFSQTIDELSGQDEGVSDALADGRHTLEGLGLDGVPGTQEWTTVTQESGDLVHVAQNLLSTYRDAGDCVLAQAGYLDLLGSVWGCVVFGGEWADMCVIGEVEEGESCQICVLRLTREELADVFDEGS